MKRRNVNTSLVLVAENKSDIKTYRKHKSTLNFGQRASYLYDFVIIRVSVPIIGIDFLENSDFRRHRFANGDYTITIRGVINDSVPMNSMVDKNHGDPYTSLSTEYAELTKIKNNNADPKHFVQYHIVTNGPSANARSRRLDIKPLKVAKQEFDRLMTIDIVRPLSSL